MATFGGAGPGIFTRRDARRSPMTRDAACPNAAVKIHPTAAVPTGMPLAAISWSRIRVVAFDMDGTLYDHRPLRRRMWFALMAHCLARPRDLTVLRTLRTFRRLREELAEEASEGIGRLQYERPAALLGLSPEAVRVAVETWMHNRPLPLLRRCRYPGVERVFQALKASGRMTAVFSDYPAGAKLEALGLRHRGLRHRCRRAETKAASVGPAAGARARRFDAGGVPIHRRPRRARRRVRAPARGPLSTQGLAARLQSARGILPLRRPASLALSAAAQVPGGGDRRCRQLDPVCGAAVKAIR
jgi:phosphoglycolate phosphatase-like HAD superfamily hydrolase